MRDAVSVLFVDEAGQMSLANAVAVSGATKGLVLLVIRNSSLSRHTPSIPTEQGRRRSGHLLLAGHETVPDELGPVFSTSPTACTPTSVASPSEVAYENRLRAAPDRNLQRVDGEAGLRFVPVDHVANTVCSPEEATVVAAIINDLVGRPWRDHTDTERAFTLHDVVVIAPYNAHVAELSAATCGASARRDGRQVPRTRRCRRRLFDGVVER